MSSAVLPVNPSYVMNEGKNYAFHFILKEAIFVVLENPENESVGICLGDHALKPGALEKVFETLVGQIRAASEYQVKILAATKETKGVEEFFLKKGVEIKATVEKQNDLEVVYEPRGVKLRFATPIKGGALQGDHPERKLKVLIVDDSKTIRTLLTNIFKSDSEIEVIGALENPRDVENFVRTQRPDVITLDIHMPEMDGVTLLRQLLPKFPIPTVMISSISMEEGPMVLNTLEVGAVDYVQKPSMEEIPTVGPMIIEKVKNAHKAKVHTSKKVVSREKTFIPEGSMDQDVLIAMGASTGGTEALKDVLTLLPPDVPPIVIVQHIPPVFSKAFADRMNTLCDFEVKEAEDGDELRTGRVLIAPGATQMGVVKGRGGYQVKIDPTAGPVNRHKPSVDFLFDSVAALGHKKMLAVILTGMGADGAKGMRRLRDLGARTIAQDEASCVVFGMPREAIKLGGAEKVVSLDEVASQMTRWLVRNKAA